MSVKEIDRVKVLEKYIDGHLTQKKVGEILNIGIRQTKRICMRYKIMGAEGLIHQGRGKPSSRRMALETRNIVKEIIIKEEFNGFGATLLQETLEEEYEIKVGREWLRQLLIAEGRWRPKKVKKIKYYPRRERRSRKGELIQLDGSYEYWFEDRGPKCCLLVMIDDATSEIMAMRFVEHEKTENYFTLIRDYINLYKRPLALYSDRHSVFKVSNGEAKETGARYSQYERAMKELEIELIHARSPQAKGRVERANKTLQDRLIKKMRRLGIATKEEGNAYLEEYRKDHNSRFAKLAENQEDAHVELLPSMCLDKILVIKEKRKISKNLEVSYQNTTYQLDLKNCARRMQGKEVDIIVGAEGNICIEIEGKEIKYSIYREQEMRNTIICHKKLDVFQNNKKYLSNIERHRKGMACNF